MTFLFARLYTLLYYLVLKTFHLKLKGLGIVQTLITRDHILSFKGKKIYYNHKVQGSYDCLLIGKSNEPETHKFFSFLFTGSKLHHSFIDVGASIGEMVFGVSIYPCIKKIVAFEPRKECVAALQESKELNHEDRLIIIDKAVGVEEASVSFFNQASGSASGLQKKKERYEREEVILQTTLDHELSSTLENPVILIDVEGFEPEVIKGGLGFIANKDPLIIFEYNEVSKKQFHLTTIQDLLGDKFEFYRLRSDGKLDVDFENTWNCVAVPRGSVFEERIQQLIVPVQTINR